MDIMSELCKMELLSQERWREMAPFSRNDDTYTMIHVQAGEGTKKGLRRRQGWGKGGEGVLMEASQGKYEYEYLIYEDDG